MPEWTVPGVWYYWLSHLNLSKDFYVNRQQFQDKSGIEMYFK